MLPSHGEGWGRPILEAMAMALPVVSTNWSGPTEYLTAANAYPLPVTAFEPCEMEPQLQWATINVSALQVGHGVHWGRGRGWALGERAWVAGALLTMSFLGARSLCTTRRMCLQAESFSAVACCLRLRTMLARHLRRCSQHKERQVLFWGRVRWSVYVPGLHGDSQVLLRRVYTDVADRTARGQRARQTVVHAYHSNNITHDVLELLQSACWHAHRDFARRHQPTKSVQDGAISIQGGTKSAQDGTDNTALLAGPEMTRGQDTPDKVDLGLAAGLHF